MPILKVLLEPPEREALNALAGRERRDPRAQAAIIIRRDLERRGLLPKDISVKSVGVEVAHAQAA